MKLNLAGFEIEVAGLESIVEQFQRAKIEPKITINKPVVLIPAEEVIKRGIPYFIILACVIWISVLVVAGKGR